MCAGVVVRWCGVVGCMGGEVIMVKPEGSDLEEGSVVGAVVWRGEGEER